MKFLLTMKYRSVILLSILFVSLSGFESDKSHLTHAKTYEVVGGHVIDLTSHSRKAKMWFIISEAKTYDEFAQTTILAALEFHKKHREYDLIQVMLVPDKDMVATGTYYASAHYAVDKKGAKYVSGADQKTMTNFKWMVRAAEEPLNKQELEIARLWHRHQADFPSEDLFSSLSYNEEKLVNFIADSLKSDIEEIYLPRIKLLEYKGLVFLD